MSNWQIKYFASKTCYFFWNITHRICIKYTTWIHLLIISIWVNNSPLSAYRATEILCNVTRADWLIWLWLLLCYVPLSQILETLTLAFHSVCPCQHFLLWPVTQCQWILSNQQLLCGLWNFGSYRKVMLLFPVFLISWLIFLGILKNKCPETCGKEFPYGNPNSYNSLPISRPVFLLSFIAFRIVFWKHKSGGVFSRLKCL